MPITSKSDVWSFGATFWEILHNGERPPKVCRGEKDLSDYKKAMMDFTEVDKFPKTEKFFFENTWQFKPETS